MILERFFDEKLAQTSYLIGCAATGEAIVVDPSRDVAQYLEAAAAEGVRITHVAETHIHADYVSGLRELAQRAKATAYLSDEGDEPWKYGFADEGPAVLLRDGDRFRVGNITFDVLHTPGHTPEHLTFLVTDGAAADRPIGALTGDFVFVGDVGRPDLLEKAAGVAGTMERGARDLFRSLQRFKEQPDWLQIWPGHGAGSACGKGLSAIPHSTVGYERLFNWAFQIDDEEEFVRAVLEGQPEPPRYFAEMKRINREGPRILGGFRRPPVLDPERLEALLQEGATVVDTRPWEAFASGHVPGTINIPLDRSFTMWAGWLVPYHQPFHLIVENERRLDEAVRDLSFIGLDQVGGVVYASELETWAREGDKLESATEVTVHELDDLVRRRNAAVLDVRGQAEWEGGRIPSVPNIPLGYLAERLGEIPRDRPVVLHCLSGARSAIGVSLLRAHGFRDVANLRGGFAAWAAAAKPVARGAEHREGAVTR